MAKVHKYVLREGSRLLAVFDTLEDAQEYAHSQIGFQSATDTNGRYWWLGVHYVINKIPAGGKQ